MTKDMISAALDAKTEECKTLAELLGLADHPTLFNIIKLRDNLIEKNPNEMHANNNIIGLKNSLQNLLFDKDEQKIFFYFKAMDAFALAEVLYFYNFR